VIKSVLWGTAAAWVLATSPAWAELKIGVVDYTRLMQEAPQAKQMMSRLHSEFDTRGHTLAAEQQQLKQRDDKYQRDSATLSDDQRAREEQSLRDAERNFERRSQEYQDDFNARRNEEVSRLQRDLVDQVKRYAKAENFDLVLAQGVIYATTAIDITPAILTRLQQAATTAKPGSGAAPKAAKSTGE
jgi:outer membrane protein